MRYAVIVLTGFVFFCATPVRANELPLADAGADQSVWVGDEVQLVGSATDPDGDAIVAASWIIEGAPTGSTAQLSDPTILNPTFVPDQPGDYLLSLVVSDSTAESIPSTVAITVSAISAPSVSSDPTLSVRMATVKFNPLVATFDRVQVWADFGAGVPAPDGAVSIHIDAISLFSQPFSNFRSDGVSGVALLSGPDLFVRLDFDRNSLFMSRRNVNLDLVDNSNGVDVELFIGDEVAIENITMLERPGNRLVFRRSDP